MSSDMIYDNVDDANVSVFMSMKASGHAWLSIDTLALDVEEDLKQYKYHLSPDEKGWANAAKIINGLQGWMDHTKRIMKNDN